MTDYKTTHLGGSYSKEIYLHNIDHSLRRIADALDARRPTEVSVTGEVGYTRNLVPKDVQDAITRKLKEGHGSASS